MGQKVAPAAPPRPRFCDNVDPFHSEIHSRRLKARQLAHAGRFDSALLMVEMARDLVEHPDHICTLKDTLRADVETTEWYVNKLRRPTLIAEEILAAEAM